MVIEKAEFLRRMAVGTKWQSYTKGRAPGEWVPRGGREVLKSPRTRLTFCVLDGKYKDQVSELPLLSADVYEEDEQGCITINDRVRYVPEETK